MTLGQLEAETLRLIFANTNNVIGDGDMDTVAQNPDYEVYMRGMVGAINRCFSDLVNKHVLPIRSKILDAEKGEWVGNAVRFDLPAVAPDCADVEKVVVDGIYYSGYVADADVRREGDTLIVAGGLFDYDTTVRVIYFPAISPLAQSAPYETVIPVPDRIAVWIPYYLKSELYRADEPNEAGEARNFYESAMADILAATGGRNGQVRVDNVYSSEEM